MFFLLFLDKKPPSFSFFSDSQLISGILDFCHREMIPLVPSSNFYCDFLSSHAMHSLVQQLRSHPLVVIHTSPIVHSAPSSPLSLLHCSASHLTLPSLSISPYFPSLQSFVSMATVGEALSLAENRSWAPFRAAAVKALFSPLLWMMWGSQRRTGGTHLSRSMFFIGQALCICRLWGEVETEQEEGRRKEEEERGSVVVVRRNRWVSSSSSSSSGSRCCTSKSETNIFSHQKTSLWLVDGLDLLFLFLFVWNSKRRLETPGFWSERSKGKRVCLVSW